MAKHRKEPTETAEQLPRTLVIGVYTPGLQHEASHYFEEFSRLVETAGIDPTQTLYLKLRSIDNAFFFTKGKLQEIQEFCDKNDIEHVVVSSLLSAMQERNLEDVLNCKVYGRAELILNIFQQAAHSAEGRVQVEMAILAH
ncbi:MAG: GTPase HflX, partial [Candidatus Dependentiae bacterium]